MQDPKQPTRGGDKHKGNGSVGRGGDGPNRGPQNNPDRSGNGWGRGPNQTPPTDTNPRTGGLGQGGPDGRHLNHRQENAFELMRATLRSWGLGSLIDDLRRLIVKGDTAPDTLTLALRNTNAYKVRFAGNELRIKNGLAALNEADYLSAESGYQQVLRAYGLPRGFYDKPSDFADLIGKGVSPSELSTRAQIAHDQYMAAPDAIRNLWSQYFGKGNIIASILDPDVATAVIQDRATQVSIGGAAAMQGLDVNQRRAQHLQEAGVDINVARKAYAQIAQSLPTDQNIAQRFGTTFDQKQEENDLLLNDAGATQKRQTLYDEEQGLFRGESGVDSSALGVSQSY